MKDESKLDFHNHLIPGVDDGAGSIDVSMAGIDIMAAQGIRHIVATPHLRASLVTREAEFDSYLADVNASWQQLLDATKPVNGVELRRGFEILLDVPTLDLSNPLLRLGGSKFALVEFPFLSIPPHSSDALFNLRIQGYMPIVAHPERYADVQADPSSVEEWRRVGAHLQANAGSFVGQYGRAAQRSAWKLLELGCLSYVCSDFHSIPPCHTESAFEAIEKKYGSGISVLLFSTNPLRILASEPPLAVLPPLRKGFLARIWFRNKS